MPQISRSRIVSAAPDAIWASLARLDEISRWASNVDHASVTTTNAEGVGAARRVQAGPITVIEVVTEWEPGRRLTYTIEGLPLLVKRVTNSWGLESAPGGTRVTLTTTLEHRGSISGRVAAFMLGRVLARLSDQLLSGLAHHHRTSNGANGSKRP